MEDKIKQIETELKQIKKQNLTIIQILSTIETNLRKKKRKPKKEKEIVGEDYDN